MRAAAIASTILGWLTAVALAAPAPGRRVVLADPDPELRHAMEQALAPWRLELVIEGPPPADAAAARQRAEADTARFVVWRDRGELVVYDRELATLERRQSQAGVLDPPAAAAAALTIKTMMRLPPPPPPDAPAVEAAPAAPAAPSGVELRVQAQLASRFAADSSARFGGAVLVRPWRAQGWRFGLAGDAGTSLPVSGAAGFTGTWSEWALAGVVGWSYARTMWEIEPHVGFGIRRSTLDGTEKVMGQDTSRSDSATLATARGGVSVRLRVSRWTLGLTIDADETFNPPAYDKSGNGKALLFQVPDTGLELGFVSAIDL